MFAECSFYISPFLRLGLDSNQFPRRGTMSLLTTKVETECGGLNAFQKTVEKFEVDNRINVVKAF